MEWKELLFLGIILLPALIYLFWPNHQPYWMEVNVYVDKNTLTETVTYHIEQYRYTELYRDISDVSDELIDFQCPTGFEKVQTDEELVCRREIGIDPGTYSIRVVWKRPGDYVKWVSFEYAPTEIRRITTNGVPAWDRAGPGDPVVIFYPEPRLGDLLFAYMIRFLNHFPKWEVILVSLALIIVYFLYGIEEPVGGIPEVYHSPPEDLPAIDVALFRTDPIGFVTDQNVERILNALLIDLHLRGAIEIDENGIHIKDESKLGEWADLIKYLAKTKRPLFSRLMLFLKPYIDKHLPTYYDRRGWDIASMVLAIAFAINMLIGLFNPDFAIVAMIFFIQLFLLFLFRGHLFGRLKDRKKFELWQAFARLLKDQSLIRKYGPKDDKMWGKWLAYAAAFGLQDNVVKVIGKQRARAFGYHPVFFRTFHVVMPRRTSRGFGGGFHAGGFSGGGGFGAR